MAIRVTYYGKIFYRDDFLSAFHDEIGERPFLADVSALIDPSSESIDVEVVSIRRDPDGKELVAFVKREVERNMWAILRTLYLNESRRGLEGDANDLEIA
jgi:hypothetical protein